MYVYWGIWHRAHMLISYIGNLHRPSFLNNMDDLIIVSEQIKNTELDKRTDDHNIISFILVGQYPFSLYVDIINLARATIIITQRLFETFDDAQRKPRDCLITHTIITMTSPRCIPTIPRRRGTPVSRSCTAGPPHWVARSARQWPPGLRSAWGCWLRALVASSSRTRPPSCTTPEDSQTLLPTWESYRFIRSSFPLRLWMKSSSDIIISRSRGPVWAG